MDQGGGQLVEMTTHQVDLLRWCMGEVEAVAAVYSTGRLHGNDPGVTVPDSQSALLRFQSGACATISTSCAVGHASLGGMDFAVKDARVSLRGDEIEIEPEGALPLPSRPEETLGIDGAFVRAVATGDRSLLKSPYEDAVKTLAVTLAANRSAEQGGRLVEIEALIRG
jgi:predicted dehydrogenase